MADEVENKVPETTDGTPPATGDNKATGTPTPEEKKFTQADLDRLITERLARETKKYADYDTIKAELKRVKETGQSDVQKLQETVNDLTAKMTAAEAKAMANLVKSSVVAAAARLDFNDPQDAYRLLDIASLEVADDGSIKGLDAILQKLLADKPYLRKQTASKSSPTNPAQPQALTLEQVKRMTPAEINARWDEVQKVVAAGR